MKRFLIPIVLLSISAASQITRTVLESREGLRAEYTSEVAWGPQHSAGVDARISTAGMETAWGYSPPVRFRARWSGFLVLGRSGWYTFATTSDDGSTVTIDGVRVVDNLGDHSAQTHSGRILLGGGSHAVVVEYFQSGGQYEMDWSWAREDAVLSPVPSWAVWTKPTPYWRAQASRFLDPVPIAALAAGALAALVIAAAGDRRARLKHLRIDWVLVAIVLFGAYFRVQYIDLPMAEAHSWRQITNADIARNFSERSMNILYPRVSWGGGGDAYVSMEFPLLQWAAAVLFRLFGEREVICRYLAIVFSLATVVGLYGLGTFLWGRPAGRGAAFLYAISPSAIFFGRTFISDVPMVCFSVFGVWGFASYLKTGRRAALFWGTTAAALACMVKIPAVIILAPIVFLAWQTKGREFLGDRALLGGLTVVVVLTVAWYGHGEMLFRRTGLGEAIWHASGAYSPEIMVAAGPAMTVSHWSTIAQLRDPQFYSTMFERMWSLHFTPVGSIVIAIGALALWKLPGRRMVDVWFGTVILFILVSAEGNRWHEFHQLPILLPAALYFGAAARPAFDVAWLTRRAPLGLGVALSAAILAAVALKSFDNSRAIPELFRPSNLSLRPIMVGQWLQGATPPGALIVTVEYEQFGGNSPILLYRARRDGWSFDAAAITPGLIARLHSLYGAQYFVTLIWSDLEKRRPDLTAYLETQDRIPIGGSDVALFALR